MDQITGKNGEFFNDIEAAKYLGVATQTLRNWRFQGRGPAYHKFGRSIRYSKKVLNDYSAKNLITPRG